jgi:hypothetical protein
VKPQLFPYLNLAGVAEWLERRSRKKELLWEKFLPILARCGHYETS